jgi:hypothetical protein
MGVPNTTTFTLQNVVDEVHPTTDDLVDCFADAVASKFDSNYEGSKNQLLNFRNYGAVTSFSTSTNATSSRLVCAKLLDITRYHTGTATYPVTGDTVWNTSSGTGVPGDGWYKSANNTAYFTTSGVITSVAIC